jgi:hypothetical protein
MYRAADAAAALKKFSRVDTNFFFFLLKTTLNGESFSLIPLPSSSCSSQHGKESPSFHFSHSRLFFTAGHFSVEAVFRRRGQNCQQQQGCRLLT